MREPTNPLGHKTTTEYYGVDNVLAHKGLYSQVKSVTDPNGAKAGWEAVKLTISRIRKMMLDILYYAKERELKTERVDVARFAGQLATLFGKRMQELHIEFVSEVDPLAGEFEADPTYLQAALANIFDNAVDACLKDDSKTDHRIVFNAHRESDEIIFEISDNGTGMESETQKKIFTLFFSSKGAEGTGLGLFVTQKSIEQHGGRIKVRSVIGHGSIFRVSIPQRASVEVHPDRNAMHRLHEPL